MNFYLGVHQPAWLATAGVPLFVSRRRLAGRRRLPRAAAPWGLDSGGFTELSLYGRWTLSAEDYVRELRRYQAEIGELAWAAPQDWMCEPEMLKKTCLTVSEHQRLTLDNFLELRSMAPDLPIVPVLQGWTMGDYLDHQEAYARAGVDLTAEPLVGVGTVCRRQATIRAGLILTTLADDGLKLHGFGFKMAGLRACADKLASADSMAWSFHARRDRSGPKLPGHEGHASCANCLPFALEWREDLVASLAPKPIAASPAPPQLDLFGAAACD